MPTLKAATTGREVWNIKWGSRVLGAPTTGPQGVLAFPAESSEQNRADFHRALAKARALSEIPGNYHKEK